MIAYIDASVLMRIVLRDPHPLREWSDIEFGVSSALLVVECHRTIDQLWHRGELDEDEVADKRQSLEVFVPRFEIIPLDSGVLELAAQPLPTSLATLDAIHLSSAILYRRRQPPTEPPILFATHDRALAKAATAMQFQVLGA